MGYIQLAILLFIYISLLFLCQNFSKRILITPEFLFLAGFIPQLAYAFFYVNKWDLNLDPNTLLVYILGGLLFAFYSLIIRYWMKGSALKVATSNEIKEKTYTIARWKLIVAIIFQLIAIYSMIQALREVSGLSKLQEAINYYAIVSKAGDIDFPNLPGKLNLFSYLSGFVWIYYIVHALNYKYKTPYGLLIINLILSFVSDLLTGSRGFMIINIVAGFFMYYLLWGEKNQWNRNIPRKTLGKMVIIILIIAVAFRPALSLLGRSTAGEAFTDYIAMYLSAEIKNIDIRISNGAMGFHDISEWNTLNNFLSAINNYIDIGIVKKHLDESTYITYKGLGMGNVYTIYYPFIQDLSYLGLFIFEAIMTLVCQLSFCKAIKRQKGNHCLNIWMLIYSYILTTVMFSFFSNWFYEKIFNTGFLWGIIVWMVFRTFIEGFNNIKIKFTYRTKY